MITYCSSLHCTTIIKRKIVYNIFFLFFFSEENNNETWYKWRHGSSSFRNLYLLMVITASFRGSTNKCTLGFQRMKTLTTIIALYVCLSGNWGLLCWVVQAKSIGTLVCVWAQLTSVCISLRLSRHGRWVLSWTPVDFQGEHCILKGCRQLDTLKKEILQLLDCLHYLSWRSSQQLWSGLIPFLWHQTLPLLTCKFLSESVFAFFHIFYASTVYNKLCWYLVVRCILLNLKKYLSNIADSCKTGCHWKHLFSFHERFTE